MAVFKRLSKEEIKADFTHYGLFCAIVPVYMTVEGDSLVSVRNWIPEWTMDFVDAFYGTYLAICDALGINVKEGHPFLVTGEIK